MSSKNLENSWVGRLSISCWDGMFSGEIFKFRCVIFRKNRSVDLWEFLCLLRKTPTVIHGWVEPAQIHELAGQFVSQFVLSRVSFS